MRLDTGANVSGSVVLKANSFIGVNGSAATISGVISDGSLGYGFTKQGNNTLTLSGANTYAGKISITGGTVSVASINSVVGGTLSSNLGAPLSVANGTIDINNASLTYTGAGQTTDRVINLSGTTGGTTINNEGSGALVFSSNLTATGSGNKTLTLGGSANGTLSGNIPNGPTGQTNLSKTGSGTWTLNSSNPLGYSGNLSVTGGTLQFNSNAASVRRSTMAICP